MPQLAAEIDRCLREYVAAMLVTVAATRGSTPREAGAAMLVAKERLAGTIGGGQLEFHAIDVARRLLAEGVAAHRLDLPLGPLFGQCCGGRVSLEFRRLDTALRDRIAAQDAATRGDHATVMLFGAGHTGRALAAALAPLPLRVVLIDDRDGQFADLPAEVATVRLDDPAEALSAAPARAAFVVLTHSHALDYRLVEMALARRDARYVGMIGSATKRALFERSFLGQGHAAALLAGLVCPIGGSALRDKRPQVIALLTAAEIARALLA